MPLIRLHRGHSIGTYAPVPPLSGSKGRALSTLSSEATRSLVLPLPHASFQTSTTPHSKDLFELFDSPFTSTCQSWQATSRKSRPRRMYRPLFPPSTKCVHQPPDVNVALTTDFPVLQLPVLYVVGLSPLPFNVIHNPLIDLPHPFPNRSSSIPSLSSLCGTFQRSGT